MPNYPANGRKTGNSTADESRFTQIRINREWIRLRKAFGATGCELTRIDTNRGNQNSRERTHRTQKVPASTPDVSDEFAFHSLRSLRSFAAIQMLPDSRPFAVDLYLRASAVVQ